MTPHTPLKLQLAVALSVLACASTLSTDALAADSSGRFTIIGHGSSSCGTVVAAFERNSAEKYVHASWVNGYISAINEQVFNGKDLADGTDVEARSRWLYNYCKERPLEVLHTATQALVTELMRRPRK